MALNKNKSVIIWLLSGCALIFIMVIIGGITRLTQSGLSIVEWDLLMGSIPPLNDAAWQELFIKYQQSPQYQLVNNHFSLEEFKSIFWWEYIHRLFGRFIGMVFFIPFVFFLLTKRLSASLTKKLLILFALGGFQGFLGWFMVKSGLVKDPAVSHYRLAAHLITAFFTFGYTFWLALGLMQKNETTINNKSSALKPAVILLFSFVVCQIVYGAFVAGLRGGDGYSTFPKMGDEWIAEVVSIDYEELGLASFVGKKYSVQFIHRWLAVFVLALLLYVYRKAHLLAVNIGTLKALNILLFVMIGQFLLGVFTLIYSVPVLLGVLHQAGALVAFAAVVYLLFKSSSKSLELNKA
jgi:heme a synthase